MRRIWPQKKQAPRTVYVGSYEDKLSRLKAIRIDPDDDVRTREDHGQEKADRNPHRGIGSFLAGPPR